MTTVPEFYSGTVFHIPSPYIPQQSNTFHVLLDTANGI